MFQDNRETQYFLPPLPVFPTEDWRALFQQDNADAERAEVQRATGRRRFALVSALAVLAIAILIGI